MPKRTGIDSCPAKDYTSFPIKNEDHTVDGTAHCWEVRRTESLMICEYDNGEITIKTVKESNL